MANPSAAVSAVVGADAHIGPLGSYGFAADFRKKRYNLRADRAVRPYEERKELL